MVQYSEQKCDVANTGRVFKYENGVSFFIHVNVGAYLVYGRPFIFIGTVDFPTSFVFPFLAYMSRSHTFDLGETSKSILTLQKMRFPH